MNRKLVWAGGVAAGLLVSWIAIGRAHFLWLHSPDPQPCDPAASEMASYLGTFLGETPDVLGWIGYLNTLAAGVEFDPSSISEDHEGVHGKFVVPGTDTQILFLIGEDGYQIEARSNATARALGAKQFNTELAFRAVDGVIEAAYGSVQFFPDYDQRFFEDGPIGYVFGTSARETTFRPIMGVLQRGSYSVEVSPPSDDKTLAAGDLGSAYYWLSRLEEVERSLRLDEG